MKTQTPSIIFRKDYTPPPYFVDTVEMGIDLDPNKTVVATRLCLTRNPRATENTIILYGNEVKLVSLRLNDKLLKENTKKGYHIQGECLIIPNAPEEVTLEIVTHIVPSQNTSLMGLYVSNGNFFTQCEAEGFRKITYFPDRPDVMAKYTVMLRANKKEYPVLLSNGNLIEEGNLLNGRHYAKWEDPFKKPSYLFALVAGKLSCHEEPFVLKSGRIVLLQVWVQKENLDKTQHAMESLKNSIRWDEDRFNLELDLDRFMIVAVDDFNMGAMENKGLNIFNSQYVLANPRVATDTDYANIEAVVAHEYFHNWTGNRVTCRDWFELSLKEGLTVFRDQKFSADMMGSDSGSAVCRIEDVRNLRQIQFREDAGPIAHPIRPDQYAEINNFYTSTVYEKGAEVVRMLHTLLGAQGFKQGMALYFERHDGQAVTCDDFRIALANANQRDLTQFERWYSQAGTPRIKASSTYDQDKATFYLTLMQSCPDTPGQTNKLPFHIPVAVGLLNSKGEDLPLYLNDILISETNTTAILELTETTQTFTFTRVPEKPTPSILRNFSAPVYLDYDYTQSELIHLLNHDCDPFNQWEAGQRWALKELLILIKKIQNKESLSTPDTLIVALQSILNNRNLDPGFRSLVLTLPSESILAEHISPIDPHAIHTARQFLRRQIAQRLKKDLLTIFHENSTTEPYKPDAVSAAKRKLKNLTLAYLLECDDIKMRNLAFQQLQHADNMTDRFSALSNLVHSQAQQARYALKIFFDQFEHDPLVVNKWFSVQATAPNADVSAIRKLMRRRSFTLKNPNRARSVIFSFCQANPAQFHAIDGSGYQFWAQHVILLDQINPQIAARLARSLDHWKKYISPLKEQMQTTLEEVHNTPNLSKDVREIISLALSN